MFGREKIFMFIVQRAKVLKLKTILLPPSTIIIDGALMQHECNMSTYVFSFTFGYHKMKAA